MKFISLDDMPAGRPDVEFKTSSFNSLIGLFTVFAMIGFAAFIVPGTMKYLLVGTCLLFLLLPLTTLRRERLSTNWLVRIRGNSLWIKFRSYENIKLPTSQQQIVQFDRSEIQAVRCVRQTQMTSSRGAHGGADFQRDKIQHLEIVFAGNDGDALRQHLEQEREIENWQDYPVQLKAPGVIWVRWSSSSARIKPGMANALKWFSNWTKVLPTTQAERSFNQLDSEPARAQI